MEANVFQLQNLLSSATDGRKLNWAALIILSMKMQWSNGEVEGLGGRALGKDILWL